MTTFGQYIRQLREEHAAQSKEFSVRKVAAKIGVEPAFLSKVERGLVSPPSEAKIIALAGLRWFDIFDDDKAAIKGAEKLGKIKSIKNVVPKPAENFWPEDEPVMGAKVKTLGQKVISNGSW